MPPNFSRLLYIEGRVGDGGLTVELVDGNPGFGFAENTDELVRQKNVASWGSSHVADEGMTNIVGYYSRDAG